MWDVSACLCHEAGWIGPEFYGVARQRDRCARQCRQKVRIVMG